MSENTTGEWIECIVDSDYEICNQYPYPIRKKKGQCIISENKRFDGSIQCFMNRKQYYKHKIIALQFIPNPNNYRYVIHIDYNKSDNHIDNLQWNKTNRH